MGQGGQIIPLGVVITVGHEHIQRFLIPMEADILEGSLPILTLIAPLLIAAEGVGMGLVRIFDLLVGGIDLLHFPCSFRISGISVRVIFLGKPAVGLFDLLVAGIPADA